MVVTLEVNVSKLFEMVHMYNTCKACLMFNYVLLVVRSFKMSSGLALTTSYLRNGCFINGNVVYINLYELLK